MWRTLVLVLLVGCGGFCDSAECREGYVEGYGYGRISCRAQQYEDLAGDIEDPEFAAGFSLGYDDGWADEGC